MVKKNSPTFSVEFWERITKAKNSNEQNNECKNSKVDDELLKRIKNLSMSTEALGDAIEDSPPGGEPSDSSDDTDDSDSSSDDSSSGDDAGDGTDDNSGDESMGDDGSTDDFGMGDDSGSGDSSSGDSSPTSGGGGDSGIDITDRKVGENPFRQTNGQNLMLQKIEELKNGINLNFETVSKFPKIPSVVVNNLTELKDIVEKLGEAVYTLPLEETMIRYKLCVKTFQSLTALISDTIVKLSENMEDN